MIGLVLSNLVKHEFLCAIFSCNVIFFFVYILYLRRFLVRWAGESKLPAARKERPVSQTKSQNRKNFE